MKVVNMHEAKTNLSKLVEQVEQGEDVVIARSGTPVARLVPYVEQRTPRVPGAWAGKVTYSPGWDDPDVEMIALFEQSILHLEDPQADR